jgi:hypothetical protein
MRCRVTANRFAASDIVILPASVVAIVCNCTRVNKGIKCVISTLASSRRPLRAIWLTLGEKLTALLDL